MKLEGKNQIQINSSPMSGTEKLPLLGTSESKRPWCFKDKKFLQVTPKNILNLTFLKRMIRMLVENKWQLNAEKLSS